MEKIKIIYEDKNVLVVDKPAGLICFSEEKPDKSQKTLIDNLVKEFPYLKNVGEPFRYGTAHRLDKDTSGILLVAKNNKTLEFLQKEFKNRQVLKKYLALVVGSPKTDKGVIETLLGRSPKNRKKQRVYLFSEPKKGKKKLRKAITKYKVVEKFKDYALVEAVPLTGRKHQIRCHFAYLLHPIAGDKLYGFRNQPCPKELKRQFLHANYLKIKLPDGETKEFKAGLPEDLKVVFKKLKSEHYAFGQQMRNTSNYYDD